MVLVNNEVGTVQPLDEMAEVVRERAPGALLHTDAAQALSLARRRRCARRRPTSSPSRRTSAAAPRASAPSSCATASRSAPQLLGGGQERERRSGTQDVAGAVGFAAAAARAGGRARRARRAVAPRWREQLVACRHAPASTAPSTDGARRRPRHRPPVPARASTARPLLFLLEQDHEVLASAAASCASGAQEPSHVLAALGLDRAVASGAVRLSLGWSTTDADVDAAVAGLVDVATRLRAHARDGAPA